MFKNRRILKFYGRSVRIHNKICYQNFNVHYKMKKKDVFMAK